MKIGTAVIATLSAYQRQGVSHVTAMVGLCVWLAGLDPSALHVCCMHVDTQDNSMSESSDVTLYTCTAAICHVAYIAPNKMIHKAIFIA